MKKAYKKNVKRFNIPGFRKGKAPMKIIELQFGEEIFYEDAFEFAFPDAYKLAIEENNLEPVAQPDIDIETISKAEGMVIKAEVAIKPEVELGEYKGIEVEKREYNVSDEAVSYTHLDVYKRQGLDGAALSTEAFNKGLPGPGGIIVAIGILLFAYSTILSWSYYGERCAEYLFGSRINKFYRIIWVPFIYIGSVGGLELMWNIADTLNGLMAIPNLIGLIGCSGIVFKLTKEYFSNKNAL